MPHLLVYFSLVCTRSLARTRHPGCRLSFGRIGKTPVTHGVEKERVASHMAVSKERKAELIKEFGKDANDSGSAEVQVAILTERHSRAHRARQGPQEGPPHASWPAYARRQASPSPLLHQGARHRELPSAHRKARYPRQHLVADSGEGPRRRGPFLASGAISLGDAPRVTSANVAVKGAFSHGAKRRKEVEERI